MTLLSSPHALLLLLGAGCVYGQEYAPISYVLEPFERQHPSYSWTDSSLEWSFTKKEKSLFGDAALEMKTTNNDGEASLDVIQAILDLGAHNCFHADYLSVWYQCESIGEQEERQASLRLVLFDDDGCPSNGVEEDSLCNSTDDLSAYNLLELQVCTTEEEQGWTEARVFDFEDLNLRRIKGYRIELEGNLTSTLLLDQLAFHGDSRMLSNPFNPGDGRSFATAVAEENFIPIYHNSLLSENNTVMQVLDGALSFDPYLLEQTESWGGHVNAEVRASGAGYWNLSGATELVFDYSVTAAATPAGSASLRVILGDCSACLQDCHSIDDEESEEDCELPPEQWYAFHSILDEEGDGQLRIPLQGGVEAGSPFWLTGWIGSMGDSTFNPEIIRTYMIELSLDSLGGLGYVVNGGVELKDIHASSAVLPVNDGNGGEGASCVKEDKLYLGDVGDRSTFTQYQHKGSSCCELCHSDPGCLFAVADQNGHCYTAPFVPPREVHIRNTTNDNVVVSVMWMDDTEKRGDFCDRCECNQWGRSIDCRNKNLSILPKTFNETWTPTRLDLQENPNLTLMGSGAMPVSITDSVEVLLVSTSMRHIVPTQLEAFKSLQSFEVSSDQGDDKDRTTTALLNNAVLADNGFFSDVCCEPGEVLQVGLTTTARFCDLQLDETGLDSVYFEDTHYIDAPSLESLRPSSPLMGEAAQSREKCAEYCAINDECRYFALDYRASNAENTCYLLATKGVRNVTEVGWVVGFPPRTRHDDLHASVQISEANLEANPDNGFVVEYEVSLGSKPSRGAVWIEPIPVDTKDKSRLVFSPERVALYDDLTTATITVKVNDVLDEDTIVLDNIISSCDEAFTMSNQQEGIVLLSLIPPEKDYLLEIVVAVAAVCTILLIYFCFFYLPRRRQIDSVWNVNAEELKFGSPPTILGRGTFGLVVLAEYRGTKVAVKRVIPAKDERHRNRKDIDSSDRPSVDMSGTISDVDLQEGSQSASIRSTGSGSVGTDNDEESMKHLGTLSTDMLATQAGGTLRPSDGGRRWRDLRSNFIQEMRFISTLRHPCVTTVMGAVVDPKVEPMLIMEYMDHGSLYDLLHNETMAIEGEVLLPILRDISQGMRFLHSAVPQVIHGDLKSGNILVDSRFRAKVSDFGFSQKNQLGGTSTGTRGTGTPYWMAPELLRREATTSAPTDVYSFGVILYEVYSRKEPYEGEDPSDVIPQIVDTNVKKRPPIPASCPPEVQSLMRECFQDVATCRPSFEEIDTRLQRANEDAIQPSSGPGGAAAKEQHSQAISLFDIFPHHIAETLQAGRTVEPEQRDCVTIFFSDIVNFTSISSNLEPRKVANLLDRLYTKFDQLSQKHDIFKVETIGDAYMAVTNLVKDQPDDHVQRIASFAIEAVEAANSIPIDVDDANQGFVHIRVGFHSGPVVADVVGTRSPRYCLFGDTVNTASRLESNSKIDRIHCSNDAAQLLMDQDPEISMRYRGKVMLKGKGFMPTYWVNETAGPSSRSLGLSKRRNSISSLGLSKRTGAAPVLDESFVEQLKDS